MLPYRGEKGATACKLRAMVLESLGTRPAYASVIMTKNNAPAATAFIIIRITARIA